jgi:prepilin-type N-terminal cleavage/methylation domain-containing protein
MKRFEQGFTLLELLVSMAVLAVVLFIVAQIISQASNVSERESKQLSSFSGVTSASDRLATDLARRMRGNDFLTVAPDGKTLSFYAQVRNSAPQSRMSLVTYLIKDGKLLRKVEPVDWADHLVQALPATDGETLSDEVFGLEFSFLRRDGSIYPDIGSTPESNGALVATFACLDSRSRKRLPDAGTVLQALNSSLTGVEPTGSKQTPLHLWNSTDLSQQISAAQGANTIRSHTFFYERYYSLD